MAYSETLGEVSLMAAINGVIANLQASLGFADSEFLCECSRFGCKERVTLTRSAYAALRDASLPVLAAHAAEPSPRSVPVAG